MLLKMLIMTCAEHADRKYEVKYEYRMHVTGDFWRPRGICGPLGDHSNRLTVYTVTASAPQQADLLLLHGVPRTVIP